MAEHIEEIELIFKTDIAGSVDYGNIKDSEEPNAIAGANSMKFHVDYFRWGHMNDIADYSESFKITFEDVGDTTTHAAFEAVAQAILDEQEDYDGSGGPYALKISPLLILAEPVKFRTYKVDAYWEK